MMSELSVSGVLKGTSLLQQSTLSRQQSRASGGTRHRVLMVMVETMPGGARSHLMDLAEALMQSDRIESVDVLTGTDVHPTFADQWKGITRREPMTHPALRFQGAANWTGDTTTVNSAAQSAIARALAATQATVLHGHCFIDDVSDAVAALRSLQRQGLGFVHTTHDPWGKHIPPMPFHVDVYVSKYLKEAFAQRQPDLRQGEFAAVIYPVIDADVWNPDGQIDQEVLSFAYPRVVAAGRLVAWKGPLEAVREFAHLRHMNGILPGQKWGSLIFSSPPVSPHPPLADQSSMGSERDVEADVLALAHQLGIADSVHIIRRDRSQLPAVARAATIGWQPSTSVEVPDPLDPVGFEGLGMTAMELRGTGLVTLVSSKGGPPEVVPLGAQHELVCDLERPGHLAQLTQGLLQRPSRLEALSTQGIVEAQTRFNLEQVQRNVIGCYDVAVAHSLSMSTHGPLAIESGVTKGL